MDKEFEFLLKETSPKVLVEAVKLYGIKETIGNKSNPIIIQWAKDLNIKEYNDDSIPWCGLFMAKVVSMAGKDIVKNPLWAQNWLNYGTKVDEAMLGDLLVFKRTGGGHIAIYVGEDATRYYCLGGNQGDEVNIVPILKDRCVGIRRTKWSIAQPTNVRKVFIKTNKNISTNER
jgi:uncharacterized protein (TIGR02594 family)